MIHSRLFRKTLIFFIILFGVVANVTALYSAWLLYERLSSEYTGKAIAIARSVAHSDLELIARRDAAFIQSKIDQYLDIEGVSYVLVTDGNGEVLAHTFVPVIPEPVLELTHHRWQDGTPDEGVLVRRITLRTGDVIHVAVPVLAGVGGFVHIGMDRSIIMSYIKSAALQQQGITMVIFVISAIIALLFIRSISRPLGRLTEYAKQVAAHDFSGTLDVTTKDEVGDLAQTMQSMSHELAVLVDDLETAVAEKTGELQEAFTYVSTIIGNIAEGLLVVDSEGRVTRSNPALECMFGVTPDEIEGCSLEDVFAVKDIESGNAPLVTLVQGMLASAGNGAEASPDAREGDQSHTQSMPVTVELECQRRDGTWFPAEVSVVRFEQEGLGTIIAIFRDVTERRRAQEAMKRANAELEKKVTERTRELSRMNSQLMLENAERRGVEMALRRTEERYRSIFENAIEGIFQTTKEGRCINANPAFARILGYESPQQLMTEVRDVAEDVYVNAEDRLAFLQLASETDRVANFEFRARRRDGEIIWVATNARKVMDKEGRVICYEGFLEDMTLRKEALDRLEHQAYHDPLTGLPNRLLFQDHLSLALMRRQRRSQYTFAVLYLDLDRFKVVNDSLGHAVGDGLLCHVAEKLKECVRDMDTVARFGGDEFAILLEEIGAPREAVRIARRIAEKLAEPVVLDGHEVFTSASVGIVLKIHDYLGPHEVLRDADTAMYRAKELGKARFKVFNQRMHEEALRLMALETELRKAVERKDFTVYYQPVIDIKQRCVCGVEALVRWYHPSMGEISPVEFIPLAEDSGLILELGDFVMEEAARQAMRWNAMPGVRKERPFYVSINISGRQFMQPDFAGNVESRLREWNFNPDCLRFEITESVLMEHVSLAVETLSRLRALGVSMCIDDFGTGYSSLSYLQRLPVDIIKVDRSFIAQMDSNDEGRSIVRSILSLGFSLGLNVVAEGVEQPYQEELLGDMGCRYVQGFLYATGLPREAIDALLRAADPYAALRLSHQTDGFRNASGV